MRPILTSSSSISFLASPEPQIVTIDSDSNEPTMPYGFGRQLPIIPPSLNDLNLPPNPFNILATMVVVNPTEDGHDENYSPQSPESSEPSLISTPPMNLSTIEEWETPHTTTDDNTFYSDDEPRWFIFYHQALPHRRHPGNWKANWALECPSQKKESVAARLRGLWTIAPWAKGYTRLVVNKLKTEDWKFFSNI